MEYLTKVGVAQVVGGKEILLKIVEDSKGEATRIMRAGGVATSFETGVGTYGPWACLVGDFICQNLLTDKKARSSRLFLPDMFIASIVTALKQPVEVAEGADSFSDTVPVSVTIGLDVLVSESSKVGGYQFSVEPLVDAVGADPVGDAFLKLGVDPKEGVKKVTGKKSK